MYLFFLFQYNILRTDVSRILPKKILQDIHNENLVINDSNLADVIKVQSL
jgi:hypothetical protein